MEVKWKAALFTRCFGHPSVSFITLFNDQILDKRDVVIVGETGMQMKQMHRVKVVALTNFMEVFFSDGLGELKIISVIKKKL